MNNNDPSVFEARRRLRQMFPGLLISVACNAPDDSDMIIWGISVSKKLACCAASADEKVALAFIPVAWTFQSGVESITRMLAAKGIHPVGSND